MDTAVVEDKIHAGKLLPRLLGFQIELHHPLVTCQQTNSELQHFLTRGWRLLKECARHLTLVACDGSDLPCGGGQAVDASPHDVSFRLSVVLKRTVDASSQTGDVLSLKNQLYTDQETRTDFNCNVLYWHDKHWTFVQKTPGLSFTMTIWIFLAVMRLQCSQTEIWSQFTAQNANPYYMKAYIAETLLSCIYIYWQMIQNVTFCISFI